MRALDMTDGTISPETISLAFASKSHLYFSMYPNKLSSVGLILYAADTIESTLLLVRVETLSLTPAYFSPDVEASTLLRQ